MDYAAAVFTTSNMTKVAPDEGGGYLDELPTENPCVCAVTCLTDCCCPFTAFCCCPCMLCKGGMTYKLEDASWKARKVELCHTLQSWLIRHPCAEGYCFCCIRPCVTIHDVAAYGSSTIRYFSSHIGDTWCDNMKVEVGDPEQMRLIMTSPQEGGPALGQAWLRAHKLPHSEKGQPIFPISLPNGLGGDRQAASDMHTDIRKLIWKYLINEKAYKRQSRSDPVIARLLLNMRKAAHGKTDRSGLGEWGGTKDGLAGFILRYMHYVLFDLDLTTEQFDDMWDMYFNPSSGLSDSSLIVVLMRYIGPLKECLGNKPMEELPARRQKAIDLYITTPSLKGYAKDEVLSVRDFSEMMITVLGLAGLMGPLGAASHTLGNYKRYIPDDFAWPFGDRDKIQTCVFEAMRMQPAVFGSGLTAPRPMKCVINGKMEYFPKGTPLHCNFVAVNQNPRVWGDKAKKFDPYAHADMLKLSSEGGPYPNFNSWGGKGDPNEGRECPGTQLSITMLIDLVEVVMAPSVPAGLAKVEATSAPPSPPSSPLPPPLAEAMRR